jgi:hypothetical protein
VAGWKELGNVHESFCRRVMEVPLTSANAACVEELVRGLKQKGESTGEINEILVYILANRLYKCIMGRTGIG